MLRRLFYSVLSALFVWSQAIAPAGAMLQVQQLIGFGLGPGAEALTAIFLGTDTDGATGLTTFTYTVAGSGSYPHLAVAVCWEGAVTLSSVTIGGTTAAIGVQVASGDFRSAIVVGVEGPTNDNIVVTYSAAADKSAAAFWGLQNLASTTAVDTNTNTGTDGTTTASVSTSADGYAFGGVSHSDNVAQTWSSFTERADFAFGSNRCGAGDVITTGASAAPTVTFTAGGHGLGVASYR